MPNLPAICQQCGQLGPSFITVDTADGGEVTDLTLGDGIGGPPCKYCGGEVLVPRGTFDHIDGVLANIRAATGAEPDWRRLQDFLAGASDATTWEEVERRAAAAGDDVVDAVRAVRPPSGIDVKQWIAILTMIGALLGGVGGAAAGVAAIVTAAHSDDGGAPTTTTVVVQMPGGADESNQKAAGAPPAHPQQAHGEGGQ